MRGTPRCAQALITDGHAPARYRALTVRNLDAWYDAFRDQAGRRAVPAAGEKRVKVW